MENIKRDIVTHIAKCYGWKQKCNFALGEATKSLTGNSDNFCPWEQLQFSTDNHPIHPLLWIIATEGQCDTAVPTAMYIYINGQLIALFIIFF